MCWVIASVIAAATASIAPAVIEIPRITQINSREFRFRGFQKEFDEINDWFKARPKHQPVQSWGKAIPGEVISMPYDVTFLFLNEADAMFFKLTWM